MIFTPLSIAGAFALDEARNEDERGFFARTFCVDELRAHGIEFAVAQANASFNTRRGTLRGMHFQREALGESKIVRVPAGAAYDVVLDLRPNSPSYLQWQSVDLSAENRRAVYIPEGCAHGFITLVDATEVHYLMGAAHAPQAAAGVRHDDPAFGIKWPIAITSISERDRTYPDYQRHTS